MSDNILPDKEKIPDDGYLKQILDKAFVYYSEIKKITSGFMQEWKHYGRKYGWKFKIHDEKKTLLELTVMKKSFQIGMAIREEELNELKNDSINNEMLDLILKANKYPEGYGIKLDITDEKSFKYAEFLINYIIEKRKK
jgi:hypothetical protein